MPIWKGFFLLGNDNHKKKNMWVKDEKLLLTGYLCALLVMAMATEATMAAVSSPVISKFSLHRHPLPVALIWVYGSSSSWGGYCCYCQYVHSLLCGSAGKVGGCCCATLLLFMAFSSLFCFFSVAQHLFNANQGVFLLLPVERRGWPSWWYFMMFYFLFSNVIIFFI